MRRVALALALAGCYAPTVPFGAPCGPGGECPNGQQCDGLTSTCTTDPTELSTWRDDTAADFMQPGATLRDATIEAAGFVGPVPYATGRVRLAGMNGDLIGDPTTATWADLNGTITGRGFWPNVVIDYGDGIPPGLGLTSGDDVTVLVEGEIELDVAGTWRFELTANEHGFVEIAPPGGDFTRLVDDIDSGTVVSYAVTTPGWHRIRGAFADPSGTMSFDLIYDPPNGSLQQIRSSKLRARVDDLVGFAVDGFEDHKLMNYDGTTLSALPLDATIGADAFGIPVGLAAWSFRWAGQLLVEVEGDYAFRIESFHGHRAWLDGVELANAFGSTAQTSTPAPVHLEAGWHDLVVDVTKDASNADGKLRVVVESGPMWAGQVVPADHVRPVLGRHARWSEDHFTTDVSMPDSGSTTRGLVLDLPPGITPLDVLATFELEHSDLPSTSVTLTPPAGATITLAAQGSLTGSGVARRDVSVPANLAGTNWNMVANDHESDLIAGTFRFSGVTILYRGGVAPFPTSYRYESAPRELGDVSAFGPVRWQTRQGDTAKLQLRTCDTAAACASEPWVDVALDAVPTVAPRRFAQYAVEITSDGDVPTALDWIEIRYGVN